MPIGVRAQRGRRSRVPKHSRLRGSTPPEPLGWAPTPFPRVPGSPVLGQRARGSRSPERGRGCRSEFKANFASAARGAAPRAQPGRAGAHCAPKAACSPPPGTRARTPAAPLVSPRSGRPPPGADPLGAGSGQPGSPHTSTCAPPSARPAFKSAPPTRALLPSLVHEAPAATGIGAGARDAGALFRGRLISRRAPQALGPGGGPYGTSPSSSSPPPRSRQVGTWSLRPTPAGCSLRLH